MFVDGASDLQRGQHKSPRGVQNDVDWDSWIGKVDGSQHFLRVAYVYVAKHGKSQDAHHLLPVHEQDDARITLAFDSGDEPLSRGFQKTLLYHWLECGKNEEEPKEIARCHR